MRRTLFYIYLLVFPVAICTAENYIEQISEYFYAYEQSVQADSYNPATAQAFLTSIYNIEQSQTYKLDMQKQSLSYLSIQDIKNTLQFQLQSNNPDDCLDCYFKVQKAFYAMVQQDRAFNHRMFSLFYIPTTAFAVLLVIFIAIVVHISKIKEESQNREKLMSTIMQVQEEERTRIAYDLHDTVVQDIKALMIFTEQLKPLVKGGETGELVDKLLLIEQSNMDGIRAAIKKISPAGLDSGDFRTFIIEYCNFFNKECKNQGKPLECKFFAAQDVPFEKFTKEMKYNLFRIIQECLGNILRHSQAEECAVIFNYKDGEIGLSISDDGKGFDVAEKLKDASGNHLGLKGIYSRVQLLKAAINIRSDSETGTEILIRVKE